MNPSYPRSDRIGRQINKLLSEILVRETQDPRLQKVNITRVEVTRDKSLARVYYTLMSDEEGVDQALEKATGFLRSSVAKRSTARKIPALRFYYDDVLIKARHIEDLLSKDDRGN